MLDLVDEFTFTLSKPLKAHVGSATEELDTLVISAPSNKHQKYVIQLRQGLNQAISRLTPPTEEAVQRAKSEIVNTDVKDTGFKAEGYTQVLFSSDIDMVRYFSNFEALLVHTCRVGGKTPLTELLYKLILTRDTERLLGEYLHNFLPLSAMSA